VKIVAIVLVPIRRHFGETVVPQQLNYRQSILLFWRRVRRLLVGKKAFIKQGSPNSPPAWGRWKKSSTDQIWGVPESRVKTINFLIAQVNLVQIRCFRSLHPVDEFRNFGGYCLLGFVSHAAHY